MIDTAALPTHSTARSFETLAADCILLLDHLTGVPDARLDWCFTESRDRVAGTPPGRIAAPPESTPRKAQFLEKLTELHCRVAAGSTPLAPAEIAFLIAARDFLSALARPVTVETIRITREYVRPIQFFLDRWQSTTATWASLRGTPRKTSRLERGERFGRGLAAQVLLWQALTVVLVCFTVTLSIYALVGRGFVQEVRALDEQFATLGADLGKAEQDDWTVFMVVSNGGHIGNGGADGESGDVAPVTRSMRPPWQHYCDMRVPSAKATPGETPKVYYTQQQQRLCDKYDGYNQKYLQIFKQMENWRTPIVEVISAVRGAPKRAEQSAALFDQPVTLAAADGLAKEEKPAAIPAVLKAVQQQRIETVHADVLLRSIAEYLLPCLYAMLGALAAALRHIARRAEAMTLDFSDGGIIIRTLVLGVLFGAVIGLFSSHIPPLVDDKQSAAASLTPAALSLLAGYSVAQVFQFFDGLALRVFGPQPADRDGRAA